MRIDPRSALDVIPQSHIVERTYYMERDYESAVVSARRLVADRPGPSLALSMAGRRTWPTRPDRLKPARCSTGRSLSHRMCSICFVRQRVPWMRQVDYDHMLEGLRKAGWQG